MQPTPAASQQHACSGTCSTCPAVGSCPDRIVCRCLKVTEEMIISAIGTYGLRTVVELREATRAGDGCTCCHRELRQYLQVYAPKTIPLQAAS